MTATTVRLHHLDVFGERPFQGNPLGVVDGADDLAPAAMQAIARELNLSETAFVLRSSTAAYRLRIFTPVAELPFAGHPSVGSAWLLADLGRIPGGQPVAFEVAAGMLESRVDPDLAWVRAPLPTPAPTPDGVDAAVLDAVGLGRDALLGPEPERWSTGNQHHVLLLRPEVDLSAVEPDMSALARLLGLTGCLLAAVGEPGAARMRYFVPGSGVPEDPATGSAAAALTGFLAARHPQGLAGGRLRIEQGAEIGRPSLLHTAWSGGEAWIGGACHRLFETDMVRP